MKYLVMECHLSYAVVLDEDGRFLKAANRHYEVGQTVMDVMEMQVPQPVPQKRKINKWMYPLAAMAACLVLVLTSVSQMRQTTYASVYMSINPEVRIDINRSDIVIGLDGVNADGDNLIEGYNYKKKNLDLVMDELVDRAITMGYLHEGGQISLVLDADSNEWVISHSDTLTSNLSRHLKEKLSVTIKVSDKNTKGNPVTIPITPAENDYGDSDYGDVKPTPRPPVSTESDSSNYADGNYDGGQTDYDKQDDVEADGLSDYDDSDDEERVNTYDEPDNTEAGGLSDYGDSDDEESDDASSNYDDNLTGYDDSDEAESDGQSDYGDSAFSDDDSDD